MPSARAGVRQQPHPPRPCPGSGARPSALGRGSFRDGGSLGLPSIRGAGARLGAPSGTSRRSEERRCQRPCLHHRTWADWQAAHGQGRAGGPERRGSPRAEVQEPPPPHEHRPWAGGLCPSRPPWTLAKAAPRKDSPSRPSTRTRDAGREKAAVRHGTELSKEDVYFQVSMEMLQTMETEKKKTFKVSSYHFKIKI